MNQAPDAKVLRETAESAALAAGDLLRDQWLQPRQIQTKGYRDLVTAADIAVQKTITAMIRARFPDHGFLAEEADGSLPRQGEVIWLVDPVDGTSNFSRSLPVFSVSIAAAVRDGQDLHPVVGVIHDPMRDETFTAAEGLGSTLNGRPMSASPGSVLDEAIVGLDWSRAPARRQEAIEGLGRIAHRVHTLRAFGSAALGLAWVAAGRMDIYFNLGLSSWDVAAGLVLVRESGGVVTDLKGRPWSMDDTGCIASGPNLLATFLETARLAG